MYFLFNLKLELIFTLDFNNLYIICFNMLCYEKQKYA
jgi:hypothetical protein